MDSSEWESSYVTSLENRQHGVNYKTKATAWLAKATDVIIAYDKLKFDKHDVIGRGAFATVYKARHVDWGCYLAYKKLHVNVDHDFTDGLQPRLAHFVNVT